MKKFFLLLFILFASFSCTACINNLAIQELNQIGKNYLDKGDFDNAIARFQSSIDLDENVFESNYNLGIAFYQKNDYKNSVTFLKKAVQIQPENPLGYYSLALALADGWSAYKQSAINMTDDIEASNQNTVSDNKNDILNEIENANEAIKMFENYLKLSSNPDDKTRVEDRIEELKRDIEIVKEDYGINMENSNEE